MTKPDVLGSRFALLSVTDKTGIPAMADALRRHGFTLLSTGGTAQQLRDLGHPVTEVSELTGLAEMFDGRVKTLHPTIHGGILYDRSAAGHVSSAKQHHIPAIDWVIVNLYDFAGQTRHLSALRDAIKHIDIGGPAMLRAAAKNHASVTVVCDPNDYSGLIAELDTNSGQTTLPTRARLASKVFASTSTYDRMIADFFARATTEHVNTPAGGFPPTLSLSLQKVQDLRYGENPHQRAALYRTKAGATATSRTYQFLQGKELSYNNLLDVYAGVALVDDLSPRPALAILKHNNPCGLAVQDGASTAALFSAAKATDALSAFGGIVITNQIVDKIAAEAMLELFLEVVVAADYTPEALTLFSTKKNLRILCMAPASQSAPGLDIRQLGADTILVQDKDHAVTPIEAAKIVTKATATPEVVRDALAAMTVAKHVRSNAIVYFKDGKTLGIGAGQMSRIDAARFGAEKAKQAGISLQGSIMASDAFFPFRDCVDLAASLGVKTIIQPGGSVRDDESIAACNEHGITMIVTGMRHFKH